MEPYCILVADDDRDDQVIFDLALRDTGLTFMTSFFNDGQELSAYLGGGIAMPAFIFLDYNMPKMNGFDTLKWIRQQQRFSTVPVYMLSTSGSDKDVIPCRKLGATGFLVKPNCIRHLSAMLRNILAAPPL